MINNKYRELEEKKDEMIDWAKDAEAALLEKMVRERIQNNFSSFEFSELLGYSQYKLYTIMGARKAKLSAELLLRFCYLFGYDISQSNAFASSHTDLDKATYEVAAIISSFPPDAIRSLAEGLDIILGHLAKERGLPTAPYRRLTAAMKELGKCVQSKEENE